MNTTMNIFIWELSSHNDHNREEDFLPKLISNINGSSRLWKWSSKSIFLKKYQQCEEHSDPSTGRQPNIIDSSRLWRRYFVNSRFFEKMIKAVINEIHLTLTIFGKGPRGACQILLSGFFSVKGGFHRRRSKFSNFHNWKYFLTLITMVTSTKGISLPLQWQPNIDDSSGLSRRYFKRIQIFREIISGIK